VAGSGAARKRALKGHDSIHGPRKAQVQIP